MRTNFIAFLPAVAFFGRFPALDLRHGTPSQEKPGHEAEAPEYAEMGGPDPYKVAGSALSRSSHTLALLVEGVVYLHDQRTNNTISNWIRKKGEFDGPIQRHREVV